MEKGVLVIASAVAMTASGWARDWPRLQADPQKTGRTTDEVRQLRPGQGENNSACNASVLGGGPKFFAFSSFFS